MTNDPNSGPRVPTERPDPEAAARDPSPGSQDRPGFDLGGAVDEANTVGSNTITGGPKGSTSSGTDAGGRATGLTDPSGSRSLGNEGDAGPDSGRGPRGGRRGPTRKRREKPRARPDNTPHHGEQRGKSASHTPPPGRRHTAT